MATLNLATILANAAAKADTVTGVLGGTGTPLDSVPKTPWVVVGMPKGTLSAGSFEYHEFTVPMRVYFALVKDWPRVMADALPFVNAMIAAFRSDITLSGSCTQCLISAWDMDVQATVASEDYQLIEFTLEIMTIGSATYAV